MAGHQFFQAHYPGAIDSLKRALSLEPEFARAHGMLSLCLHETGRLPAAMEEARLARQYDPNELWGLLAHGVALSSYNKLDESEATLRQALAISPDESTLLRYLSVVVASKGDEEGSGELLERGCNAHPDDAEMWSSRSVWCTRNGRWDEAEEYARRALRLNAEHAYANQHMGIVLRRKGQKAEAREHFLLALRARPGDINILRLLIACSDQRSALKRVTSRITAPFLIQGWPMVAKVLIVAYLGSHFLEVLMTQLGQAQIGAVLRLCWVPILFAAFTANNRMQRKLMQEVAEVKVRATY